ncbi:hypothetical protein [Parapedobacter koreensis]|uniref:PH domain-containing protein n=1 Tax=Parapedobacter koreensis TaxID=332977 RepID=A0A1H7HZC9_9SPHI|nr:hypothetical protein [Parapedobacter koreensis]SEK54500.1 hypothetical protein SAMN05421740_10237 [Parapedobacter koreensis]
MTYTYKILLTNHIKNAWTILFALVGFSLMPFYLRYKYGEEDFNLYVLVCFSAFLLFFIPQVTIHLTYYWLNEGRIFYYNPSERQITICIRGERYGFAFDDIKLVERNKSFALAGITYQWMPWDNYNYSVIHLKNGQQFVVTSLLVPNMDLPLEESKIKLRKRFYCYPFGTKEILDV